MALVAADCNSLTSKLEDMLVTVYCMRTHLRRHSFKRLGHKLDNGNIDDCVEKLHSSVSLVTLYRLTIAMQWWQLRWQYNHGLKQFAVLLLYLDKILNSSPTIIIREHYSNRLDTCYIGA